MTARSPGTARALACARGASRRTLAVVLLSHGLLASTCVMVEEDPRDTPYSDESAAQAMEEEQAAEVVRESDL